VAPRTAPPVLSLTLNAALQSDGVHLSWSKYTGPFFQYYGIVRTEGTTQPTLPVGATPPFYFDNVNTSVTSIRAHLTPGHTYHYRLYATPTRRSAASSRPAR